jgi:Domain of unknown function (DUF4158)
MTRVNDTAYPLLKVNPSDKELQEVYTPTAEEIAFARAKTRLSTQCLGLLLMLKTFQRLGYCVGYAAIPGVIVQHVARRAGFKDIPEGMEAIPLKVAACIRNSLFRNNLYHQSRHISLEELSEKARMP